MSIMDDTPEAPRRLDPNAPRATIKPRPEGRGCIATCPVCGRNFAFTDKGGNRRIIQYRCRCGAEPIFNAWDIPKLYEENRTDESAAKEINPKVSSKKRRKKRKERVSNE